MFRIKICGITRTEDAVAAANLGADAIGLNFYEKSPRCLSVEIATRIASQVPPIVCKIGVFVNHPIDHIKRICDEVGLDLIQLHGDEPNEVIHQLAPRLVVRAIRCTQDGMEMASQLADNCPTRLSNLCALLFDAHQPGIYGGTGKLVDWEMLQAWSAQHTGTNVILAGGLNPENVLDAIRVARPSAVDTASGVESSPGEKCKDLLGEFIANAKLGFEDIHDTGD